MKSERIQRIITNDLFKGYFHIPDWLSDKFEELEPIAAESGNFCTIRHGSMRTTVYQPDNFGAGNLYQLIIKRKKIEDRIIYAAEWQEQAFQDKEGNFGELPPCVLELSVAATVLASFNDDWTDVFGLEEPEVIIDEPDIEGKVVELSEKFWRRAASVAPDGRYNRNGYTIETTIPPGEAIVGIYHVMFDRTSLTFTIEPTSDAPNTTTDELIAWIKGITGWCTDLNKLFI